MVLGYSAADGVAMVTLNRPDVLNAINEELGMAALDFVSKAAADEGVRCIVITGAGRAFCSGEDLAPLADSYKEGEAPELGATLTDRYNPLIRAIRTAPKPVIAAVNGVAAGAGASIALACDFRIASEHAKLVLAFVKVGLVPDSGAIWFLTKLVGAAKAFEICALGDPVGADDALRLGLFNRVVPADDFSDTWKNFADMLASGPTRAYALTKALANFAMVRSLDEQLDGEVDAQSQAGHTQDHMEGVTAFFEKRAPHFRGR